MNASKQNPKTGLLRKWRGSKDDLKKALPKKLRHPSKTSRTVYCRSERRAQRRFIEEIKGL